MKFIDKAVFLEKEGTLVISDLHLGYEERLLEKGISIPPMGFKETMKDLEEIFEEINKNNLVNKKARDEKEGIISKGSIINNKESKLNEIIILGDLKHDFAGFEYKESDNVLKIIMFLKEKSKKIIVIKGNHDNYIINVLKREEIELVEYYEKNNLLFMHGDKKVKIKENIKKIFLGHMHPAISIRKNVKEEKYKCFLVGKWKNREIIILPSFFPLFEGSDIFEDKGEFLDYNFDLENFEVHIVGDKVYDFGKLRDVGKLV